jgi:hypothetical protein
LQEHDRRLVEETDLAALADQEIVSELEGLMEKVHMKAPNNKC